MTYTNEKLMANLGDIGYRGLKEINSNLINKNITDVLVGNNNTLIQFGNINDIIHDKKLNLENEISDDEELIEEIIEEEGINTDEMYVSEIDIEDVQLANDRINRNKKKYSKLDEAGEMLDSIVDNDGTLSIEHSEKDYTNTPLYTSLTLEYNKVRFQYVTIKDLIDELSKVSYSLKHVSHCYSVVLALYHHLNIKVDKKVLSTIDRVISRYTSAFEEFIELNKNKFETDPKSQFTNSIEVSFGNLIANLVATENKHNIEKIGKHLRKLFPSKSNSAIETLSDEIDRYFSINVDKYIDNFEEVSGWDISYYYNSYNNTYIDSDLSEDSIRVKGGSLKNSCMRYTVNYKNVSCYAINPSKVHMLILKDKNNKTLLGRALLWKVDGNTYVDRVYSISKSVENLFISYINKKGYIGIHSSSDNNKKKGHQFAVILKINPETPYIDTLGKFGYIRDKQGNVYTILSFKYSYSNVIDLINEEIGEDNVEMTTNYDMSEDYNCKFVEEKSSMFKDLNNKETDKHGLFMRALKRNAKIHNIFSLINMFINHNKQLEYDSKSIAITKNNIENFKKQYSELYSNILFSSIDTNFTEDGTLIFQLKENEINKYFKDGELIEEDYGIGLFPVYYIKFLTNNLKKKKKKEEKKAVTSDSYRTMTIEDLNNYVDEISRVGWTHEGQPIQQAA